MWLASEERVSLGIRNTETKMGIKTRQIGWLSKKRGTRERRSRGGCLGQVASYHRWCWWLSRAQKQHYFPNHPSNRHSKHQIQRSALSVPPQLILHERLHRFQWTLEDKIYERYKDFNSRSVQLLKVYLQGDKPSPLHWWRSNFLTNQLARAHQLLISFNITRRCRRNGPITISIISILYCSLKFSDFDTTHCASMVWHCLTGNSLLSPSCDSWCSTVSHRSIPRATLAECQWISFVSRQQDFESVAVRATKVEQPRIPKPAGTFPSWQDQETERKANEL